MLYAFMETKEVMKVNGYEIAYSIFSVPKSPNTGFISCFLVRLCPGGGGVFDISLCGKLWPGRHTLTLCKTKIADFPILFKTEWRFLIACVRHLTRNHAPCKTMINKNFCCSLVRRTYAQAVYRPRKDTMFMTNIDKIDSLFKTNCGPAVIPWPCVRQKSLIFLSCL